MKNKCLIAFIAFAMLAVSAGCSKREDEQNAASPITVEIVEKAEAEEADHGTDAYLCTAEVDAWNKAYYEMDYDGAPFPNELDADKDGILYQVTVGNSGKLMDLEEYEEWRDSMIGGAEKIEIPFEGMTEGLLQK